MRMCNWMGFDWMPVLPLSDVVVRWVSEGVAIGFASLQEKNWLSSLDLCSLARSN